MGVGVENAEVRGHTQPGGGSNDYRLHKHRGDLGIDGDSSTFTQTDYDDFRTQAAVSQSAFDSAVGGVLGGWYTGLSSAFKQGFRELFQRL